MLRDTTQYEKGIIDAVKSIDRALGGSSASVSRTKYVTSDINQYETQLIAAIKSIARTLSGAGISGLFGSGAVSGGYIGTTKVQATAGSQALTGITSITASGLATIGGGIKLTNTPKIWFNSTSYLELVQVGEIEEEDEETGETTVTPVYGLHSNVAFYSEKFITAGGINGSGSESTSFSLERMWASLQNTTYDIYEEATIAAVHIPIGSGLSIVNGLITASIDLSTWAGSTNVTTLGTITTGTWQGTAIGYDYVAPQYIGTTRTQRSQTSGQNLEGLGNIVASGLATIGSLKLASGTPVLVWDSDNLAWHLNGNFYADGWITAGGVNGSSSSSGIGLPRVWQSLTNSSSEVTPTDTTLIAADHIPVDGTTIVVSNGVITAVGGSGGTKYKLQLNGTWNGDTSGTSLGSFYAPTSVGTTGYTLIANSSGVPVWSSVLTIATGTATLTGNLLPGTGDTYNLGAAGTRWNALHVNRVFLGNSSTYLENDGSGNVRIVLGSGNGLWTDGWISAGGINTGSFTIPLATENSVGVIKPDGDTVTVDSSGVLSVIGGSGASYTAGTGISISSGAISIASAYLTKINAAVAGDAYGTGATAPTKIVVCKGSYPSTMDSNALYFLVAE